LEKWVEEMSTRVESIQGLLNKALLEVKVLERRTMNLGARVEHMEKRLAGPINERIGQAEKQSSVVELVSRVEFLERRVVNLDNELSERMRKMENRVEALEVESTSEHASIEERLARVEARVVGDE
jgi:polyhydroxyalkanoate synthesis regulator phasin